MALRRALGPLVVVAAVIFVPSPSHASGSIESQVFSKINGSRSKALKYHSGLAAAARAHSQSMAISGGLNHDGADERVANAPPDPAEGNGAPDDGFATAAWCENVTYSTGFPESQVAGKLYEQWRRSASHQGCMTNSAKTVGAVGVYYDGSTWWATFIAEVDRTPPGGAPVSQQPPSRAPPAPAPTSRPAAVNPAGPITEPQTEPGISSGPLSSITTPNELPSVAGSVTRNLVADAPLKDVVAPTAAPPYVVAVPWVPAVNTLLRSKRAELPITPPMEIAALAAVGLLAFRRFEGRTRARIRSALLAVPGGTSAASRS